MSEPTIEEMRLALLEAYEGIRLVDDGRAGYHAYAHLTWNGIVMGTGRAVKEDEAEAEAYRDAYSKLPAKAAPERSGIKAATFHRKRGASIKAIRWTGDNLAEVRGVYPTIGEGYMLDKGCRIGDWVISPRAGCVYFMPDAAFIERYEPQAAPENEDEAFEREWIARQSLNDLRDYGNKRDFRAGWNAALPLRPTEEEMRLAVKLCNSNGILVLDTSAEMLVTDLIVFKRTSSEYIAELEREIRGAHELLSDWPSETENTTWRHGRKEWLERNAERKDG